MMQRAKLKARKMNKDIWIIKTLNKIRPNPKFKPNTFRPFKLDITEENDPLVKGTDLTMIRRSGGNFHSPTGQQRQ